MTYWWQMTAISSFWNKYVSKVMHFFILQQLLIWGFLVPGHAGDQAMNKEICFLFPRGIGKYLAIIYYTIFTIIYMQAAKVQIKKINFTSHEELKKFISRKWLSY